jgi:hypothetical protein
MVKDNNSSLYLLILINYRFSQGIFSALFNILFWFLIFVS